jgi:3-hydroxybutyryl-CoA dehydrogenase
MTKNSVAIIGESRLARELHGLCCDKGFDAALLSHLSELAPATPIVVETCAGDGEKKKSLLQKLDDFLPPASAILTSCLGFGTTQLASWVNRPERVVGFATFYPLAFLKVIELAAGLRGGF